MPISPRACATTFRPPRPSSTECARRNPAIAAVCWTCTTTNSAITSRLIRRQDVRGFVQRRPIWLAQPLRPEQVRSHAAAMEEETRRFYEKSATRASDPGIRQLLDDLAQEERSHQTRARELERQELNSGVRMSEDQAQKRLFASCCRSLQPGLAGLMDGSVSTHARPSLPPLWRLTPPGQPSWLASPRPSAPASAWASARRSPTTAA